MEIISYVINFVAVFKSIDMKEILFFESGETEVFKATRDKDVNSLNPLMILTANNTGKFYYNFKLSIDMKTSLGLLSASTKNSQKNLFASNKKQIDDHASSYNVI